MARVKSIGRRLETLRPRLVAPQDEAGRSRFNWNNKPSKRWYKTAWWQAVRERVLLRDMFTCQRCGASVAGKGEAQVDHITPHNEDRERFFCRDDELQVLCVPCHVRVKQSEERRAGLIR